jgi:hypothetical protein
MSCYSSLPHTRRHHIQCFDMQPAQASHMAPSQHSRSCKRNGLWSRMEDRLKVSSHQPLDPRQGPVQSINRPANASTGIAARRVRRTGWLLWRRPGLAFVDWPRSRWPARRLLAFYLRHHHRLRHDMPPANSICTTRSLTKKHIGDGGGCGWVCAICQFPRAAVESLLVRWAAGKNILLCVPPSSRTALAACCYVCPSPKTRLGAFASTKTCMCM